MALLVFLRTAGQVVELKRWRDEARPKPHAAAAQVAVGGLPGPQLAQLARRQHLVVQRPQPQRPQPHHRHWEVVIYVILPERPQPLQ